MSHDPLFRSLRPAACLLFAAAVALSFAAFLLLPTGTATAASCPPGWMSCTDPAPYHCCQHLPLPTLYRNYRKVCTWWDHDINSYPTCTYKVVDQKSYDSCSWWELC